MPKSRNFVRVIDYRLISYYLVFYKVIAKVLSEKIVAVVGKKLHPMQAALVQEYSIIKNVHVA